MYGSFYSCFPLQRGWVAFARAVFGKGGGSFLAGGTELLTQPWQDRSSLFQGYLGSACPGCEFSLLLYHSFSMRLTREKSMYMCAVVSFLPLMLQPDQYLSGISPVAKIPCACWNKECIYLHGLAWWAFPISHIKKKKKKGGLKVIFESIWIFLSDWKRKMTGSGGRLAPKCFLSAPRAKLSTFWRGLFFFFFWDLGRVNDIIFEQTIWIVSYYWHIIQKSKQTRMRYRRGEGETHHSLGKSEHLKLCLLRWNCDFYSVSEIFCGPTWKAVKPELVLPLNLGVTRCMLFLCPEP